LFIFVKQLSQIFAFHVCAFLIFSVVSQISAKTNPEQIPYNSSDPFVLTPFVQRQVGFWEKIFYIFQSSTVVIHDSEDPDLIIQIIDFGPILSTDDPSIIRQTKTIREKNISGILKDYSQAIKKAKLLFPNFTPSNEIEEKINSIYLNKEKNRKRILSKQIKIRAQSGLSDRFAEAAQVAYHYLPTMESIFEKHDLPPELTRIAFVESMFNTEAKSKVGASGIWQFMPSTAKLFLFVNDLIDERNSPLKATKAAAQLLFKNFLSLKSWPHAITAYNHGVLGMRQGIFEVKSYDFDKLLLNYQSPSFGFASKNFYAEFLAARKVYESYSSQLNLPSSDRAITTSIVLPRPLNLLEISKLSDLTIDEILKFNPCILKKNSEYSAQTTLPIYFELFAPQRNLNNITKNIGKKEPNYSAF
jgi:membrane-bound lytic murein transglycosylase D